MATIAQNYSAARAGKRPLASFFAAVGRGFTNYVEYRSRTGQVEALNAKSDAELAKLGITRDQIPSYVFRDLFYI